VRGEWGGTGAKSANYDCLVLKLFPVYANDRCVVDIVSLELLLHNVKSYTVDEWSIVMSMLSVGLSVCE